MRAEEIIVKEKYKGLKNLVLICDAMDEFAAELKKENEELKKKLRNDFCNNGKRCCIIRSNSNK